MLSRRSALLASAVLTAAALPALAQQKHPAPGKPAGPGGKSAKKDQPTGSPGDTPLGPVDTAARWAFI